MVDIKIVPTTLDYIRYMVSVLREEDIESMRAFKNTPYKTLWRLYRKSLTTKTALINGKVAAVWGCCGEYLGNVGYPWLLISPSTDEYPFKIAFCYRRELNEMLQLFPTLVEMVDVRHLKSQRLMKIMGFTLGEPVPYGKNGELFIRAEKRG